MRTVGAIAAGALVAIGAARAEPSPAPTSHARTLSGTIAAIAADGKELTVRDERGKAARVTLTAATRVTGGALEPGRKVTVRWMPRDKKSVATAVRVHPPGSERTASAAPPAPPSPTPGRP